MDRNASEECARCRLPYDLLALEFVGTARGSPWESKVITDNPATPGYKMSMAAANLWLGRLQRLIQNIQSPLVVSKSLMWHDFANFDTWCIQWYPMFPISVEIQAGPLVDNVQQHRFDMCSQSLTVPKIIEEEVSPCSTGRVVPRLDTKTKTFLWPWSP